MYPNLFVKAWFQAATNIAECSRARHVLCKISLRPSDRAGEPPRLEVAGPNLLHRVPSRVASGVEEMKSWSHAAEQAAIMRFRVSMAPAPSVTGGQALSHVRAASGKPQLRCLESRSSPLKSRIRPGVSLGISLTVRCNTLGPIRPPSAGQQVSLPASRSSMW
jgi:hypothetical protein